MNPQMEFYVRPSDPPSNSGPTYYIPPQNLRSISKPRRSRTFGLRSPKYLGNIFDEQSIAIAMNGNYQDILHMFKNGLSKELYKVQLETALRLSQAVEQIQISSHDIYSVLDKYKGDCFVVDFPGIVDEDYVITYGANNIYLEYYVGDLLEFTCLCEYEKIDTENGIVHLRPPIPPTSNLTRVSLRIKQSTVPMMFSLHAISQLSESTVNEILFPSYNNFFPKPENNFLDGINRLNVYNKTLDDRQKLAVFKILCGRFDRTPFIIFGPPGTGKTTTVIEAILQVYKQIQSSMILVTAQTNKAVDNLTLKLIQTNLIEKSHIIRYSSQTRKPEEINNDIKDYNHEVVTQLVLDSVRIVCTTFVKSAVFYSANQGQKYFTHLFVDEASQCDEAGTLISINLLKPDGKLILAGDPRQLGPMTKIPNDEIASIMTNSLLHRLIENKFYVKNNNQHLDFGGYNPNYIVKLVNNYRNFNGLVTFISKLFYDDELKVKIEKGDNSLCHNFSFLQNKTLPLHVHGVEGVECLAQNSTSFYNLYECQLVLHYVIKLIENGITPHKIAVISFYKKQAMIIKRLLRQEIKEEVECQTVEKFQGSEKPVIILSTVRTTQNIDKNSDSQYSLKFLFDERRFNVAISRAISMLIVVGDPNVMKLGSPWSVLLKYSMINNAYVGCGT